MLEIFINLTAKRVTDIESIKSGYYNLNFGTTPHVILILLHLPAW